jgi:hypothetical protein
MAFSFFSTDITLSSMHVIWVPFVVIVIIFMMSSKSQEY